VTPEKTVERLSEIAALESELRVILEATNHLRLELRPQAMHSARIKAAQELLRQVMSELRCDRLALDAVIRRALGTDNSQK
jgi:hypothetical protein